MMAWCRLGAPSGRRELREEVFLHGFLVLLLGEKLGVLEFCVHDAIDGVNEIHERVGPGDLLPARLLAGRQRRKCLAELLRTFQPVGELES